MKRGYYIKKYIEAENVAEAIKNERKAIISDVWTENKDNASPASAIGFNTIHND